MFPVKPDVALFVSVEQEEAARAGEFELKVSSEAEFGFSTSA